MTGRIPISSGSNWDIKTDGLCHCPYFVPVIYIGMPKKALKKIKSNKCALCGGIITEDKLIVPISMKGGIIKKQNENTKNRTKAKSKGRRF